MYKNKFNGGQSACGWLLFIPLCLMGCAGRAPQLERDWQAQELYGRVLENYGRWQNFRGQGNLTVESPQARLSASAQVLTMKPDSIFIKVEASFGIDAGFFFANRQRFETYSPLENIYYFGETENVRDLTLFQMDLTFDEMISGLVGTALPPFDSSFTVTREDELYRFEGKRQQRVSAEAFTNGLTQYAAAAIDSAAIWRVTYWVDAKRGVVTKAEEYDASGELYARQEFKRFRQKRGVWLPQLIQMQRPTEHERLTVFYNNVEVNAKINATEFVIRVPKTARQINLSDRNGLSEEEKQQPEQQ